jgi:hypothetical protein
MTGWRRWALILGAITTVAGWWLWTAYHVPTILICGILIFITAALEPIYGRANGKPRNGSWRATDERFIDPETGRLVTVWYDPATGDRRYVDDGEAPPPAA